jgi:hypothetical protein
MARTPCLDSLAATALLRPGAGVPALLRAWTCFGCGRLGPTWPLRSPHAGLRAEQPQLDSGHRATPLPTSAPAIFRSTARASRRSTHPVRLRPRPATNKEREPAPPRTPAPSRPKPTRRGPASFELIDPPGKACWPGETNGCLPISPPRGFSAASARGSAPQLRLPHAHSVPKPHRSSLETIPKREPAPPRAPAPNTSQTHSLGGGGGIGLFTTALNSRPPGSSERPGWKLFHGALTPTDGTRRGLPQRPRNRR